MKVKIVKIHPLKIVNKLKELPIILKIVISETYVFDQTFYLTMFFYIIIFNLSS